MRPTWKILTAAGLAALLLVGGSGSVLAASRWDRAYVADMDVRGAPGDALLTDGLGTYVDDEGGAVIRLYDNAEGDHDTFSAYTSGSRRFQLDLGSTPVSCVRGSVYALSYATPQWYNETAAGGTAMVDGALACWLDSRATTGWIIGYPNDDGLYDGPNATGECLEMTRVADDDDANTYDDWTLEAPPTCGPAYLYWAEKQKGKGGGGYKYTVVDWDANGTFKLTINVLSTVADSK